MEEINTNSEALDAKCKAFHQLGKAEKSNLIKIKD